MEGKCPWPGARFRIGGKWQSQHLPASPALQSWIVLTLGIGGLCDIRPGYGRHLGSSRVVGEVGRTFQAQLWKSNRINFASSDLTTVL